MRRVVEMFVCVLFVLLMSIGAAETPGSSARVEEGLVYVVFSVLLIGGFATIMTAIRRDAWFRIFIYPATLLLSFVLLLLDVKRIYEYNWDQFWLAIPYGIFSSSIAASWLTLINVIIPAAWRKIRTQRRKEEVNVKRIGIICLVFLVFSVLLSSAQGGDAMDPQQIIEQTLKHYRSMDTFSTSGETISILEKEGKIDKV